MTTLTEASRQLIIRPADERFPSVAAMHAKALDYKGASIKQDVPTEKLRVGAAENGKIQLLARDQSIDLTNWSFGQLSTAAAAPASYMNRLPPQMAVDCINHGLRESKDRDNRLLFRREHSGMVTLRALTSQRYARIWNSDVTARLVQLEEEGPWQPAPAAFDGSRGLYMGDRDMFAFMVDNDRRIFEKGPGGGLSRGFFVRNSEVGAASFEIISFFYNFICGNHMVWGASQVKSVSIRHVGTAGEKAFGSLTAELKTYAESSAADDELRVERMRTYTIGKDLEQILDKVMGLRISGLSSKTVKAGYELAQKREDWYGAPNTVWGLAGGLTEIARDMPNADDRTALEAATGKMCEIAF